MQDGVFIRTFLGSLSAILQARSTFLLPHSLHTGLISRRLGERLELNGEKLDLLLVAGFLHDSGMTRTEEKLIEKGDLSAAEQEELNRHPVRGEKIAREITDNVRILEAVRHHHEAWNAAGFPDGRGGTDIPRFARILAVADAFDALCSHRPYRQPRAPAEALAEIRQNAEILFDPGVVDALAMETGVHAEVAAAVGRPPPSIWEGIRRWGSARILERAFGIDSPAA